MTPPEQRARELDAQDELAGFASLFFRQPGQIYLDGNSLGLLSRPAEAAVLRVLEQWRSLGIDGWTAASPPWFTLAETLAEGVAPLIGAEAGASNVANSTTTNLHQLVATLWDPNSPRNRLLADELNFPSDLYALQSQLRLRNLDPARHLVLIPSRDGLTLDPADIVSAMADYVQMLVLPSVIFTSGQLLPIEQITREAHRRGIMVGWDCSHSVGAVPHRFDEWEVDFAFWCSYKYLNGGPGAVAGLYLNRRHWGRAPGLAGWFGSRKDRQFDLGPTLEPATGAGALQIGTPDILGMAALTGSLQIFADAGMDRLRRKSLQLTDFLIELAEDELADLGFTVANPREHQRRGGHVSLGHPEAVRICKSLKEAGVVPDFRPPNLIRLAPAPLYNSFADCLHAARLLRRIIGERIYEVHQAERELVA